jgi:hypothetical protein
MDALSTWIVWIGTLPSPISDGQAVLDSPSPKGDLRSPGEGRPGEGG